ncbi:hypothetical protein [Prevotella melaninogenica]|uniref:hypothetical protein n=1 Tax=Prevotella melaninogenica TaxID=28132 RepID=UPI001BAB4E45|nr:hypothetical protein [Prevotella melaninogenica]QUB66933.1 hypothetical protein J5A57_08995 [Prevotella melaninogenica]
MYTCKGWYLYLETSYYQSKQHNNPQQYSQHGNTSSRNSQQGNSKQGHTPTNTTSRERNYITIKAVTQPSTQTPTTQHGNSKQQYRQQINGYRKPQRGTNNNIPTQVNNNPFKGWKLTLLTTI